MTHNTIVHFEIPAKNIERLKEFYSNCFNWKFEMASVPGIEYWLIQTGSIGETIGGGMYKKTGENDLPRNFISVDDIDAGIEKFKKAGGSEVVGKQEIPGEGWSFIGKDPEGNPIALFEPAKK